jgi:hypothetical protein
MTLRERQSAFARDIVRLLVFAAGKGYEYTFGEAERPIEMQRIHVQAGRSKTMNSNHIERCAFDIHFFKDGKLCYPQELGDFWESLDPKNSWGGNWRSFKDAPHFERRK